MFIDIDSILTSVNESINRTGFVNNYLKPQVNNTYIVRILPYFANPANSFAYRKQYRWKEEIPGQKKPKWHYITSATIDGEACPVDAWRNAFLEQIEDKDTRKRILGPLSQNISHICNVYVVDDPVDPKNNGKVMLLALGKTLWELVESGLKGNLNDEYEEYFGRKVNIGKMMLDPTDNGINLVIKCLPNQMNLPTYEKSRFSINRAALGLDEESLERIKSEQIDPVKSVRDDVKERSVIREEFVNSFLAKNELAPYRGLFSAANTTPSVEKESVPEKTLVVSDAITQTTTSLATNNKFEDDDYETYNNVKPSAPIEDEGEVASDMQDFINSLVSNVD